MNQQVFLALLFVIPQAVWAIGHDVGNGGDVVVCASAEGKTTYEVLDLYVARELRNIRPSLGPQSDGAVAKVRLALSRLKDLNPTRVARYERSLQSFFQEIKFVEGKALVDVPDSAHLFLDVGCHLEQAVIQVTPQFPGDPRYLINQDLWNALDTENHAVLILHELIWKELREAGVSTAVPVAYLNSLMFGDQLQNLSLQSYVKLASAAIKLPDFDGEGFVLALCRPEKGQACASQFKPLFRADGRLWAGFIVPPSPPWDPKMTAQTYRWNGNVIRVAGAVRFAPATSPSQKSLVVTQIAPLGTGSLRVGDQSFDYQGFTWSNFPCRFDWTCSVNSQNNLRRILFYPSGKLRSFSSTGRRPQVNGKTCVGLVDFDEEDGRPSCQPQGNSN